ncbi:MAG: UDP-glucose 4-epimerase GalE [Rhizobiales bacterium]|nr:UDP-glucose 4-epimerase GalE [Hyphomicrobiales bacterium]
MPVLVTGGAGYIASHMTLALLDAGEEVVVLDDLSTGVRANVPEDRVRLVVGDVGDEPLVSHIVKEHAIDAVLHFAGSVVVPDSLRDPLGYYRNNTCNTRSLAAAAIAAGVRHMVFSSTAAVYGLPTAPGPVNESTPAAPISPYGTSKLMSEMMLRDAASAHDFSFIALRYFNVAGADPLGRTGQSTPNATHLLKVACEAALGRRPGLQVFGTDYPTRDGTGVRDYIHVTDLVSAHLAALDHLRAGGASDIMNCGYGRGFSVLEVLDAVRRVAGRDLTVEYGPRRAGDPVELVADASRIRDRLAWRSRLDDLDTIVAHALAWEQRIATGTRSRTRRRAPARAEAAAAVPSLAAIPNG